MDRRVFSAFAALALLLPARALLLPARAAATTGAAGGKVCIMSGTDRVYGFSTYSGSWTMTLLETPPQATFVGDYLGYVRTHGKLYAFNSTNDHWYSTSLTDGPSQLDGQDVEGATAIAWGQHHAYGIATPWSLWRSIWWPNAEHCVGGGSGGSFGLVWTNLGAHAYSASTGQWYSQPLGESSVGGIASNGIGIVWTLDDAYAFDPLATHWSSIDLGDPFGVSAAGSGNTAVVWSHDRAQAYSAFLNQWVPTTALIDVVGGAAGGDVALVWGNDWACSFIATTGVWTQLVFPIPSGAEEPASILGSGFEVGPNPSRDGRMSFSLPGADPMTITIVDASGARVARLEAPSDGRGARIAWDGLDTSGGRVAAGTYWVLAESRSRSEARRVVVLP